MAFEIPGIDFYDGAASGQQRAALSRLEPSNVMISYATANNRPLPHAERYDLSYNLWWDCGAAPMTFLNGRMADTGEYQSTDAEYLGHVIEHADSDGIDNTLFTLRDYPCENAVLERHSRTVREHQRRTTARHRNLLDLYDDRDTDARPVTAIQGWLPEHYLTHLDELRDHGCITDYVSIGSVCARGDDHQVAEIIKQIRAALPGRVKLHAFGIKKDALRFAEVVDWLDSADSNAYDTAESRGFRGRTPEQKYTFQDTMLAYLRWRDRLAQSAGTDQLEASHQQMTLTP